MMKKAAPQSFHWKKCQCPSRGDKDGRRLFFFCAIPACPITSNFDEGCSEGRFIASVGAMHWQTNQQLREAGCSVRRSVGRSARAAAELMCFAMRLLGETHAPLIWNMPLLHTQKMFRKADYNLIYDRAANAHSAGYANDAPCSSPLYTRVERTPPLFAAATEDLFAECFYFTRCNRITASYTSFPWQAPALLLFCSLCKVFKNVYVHW